MWKLTKQVRNKESTHKHERNKQKTSNQSKKRIKTRQKKIVKNISKNPACRKKIRRVLSFERKNPACENPACAKTRRKKHGYVSLSRKVITNDEHIWNEIFRIFLQPKRRGNRCSVLFSGKVQLLNFH